MIIILLCNHPTNKHGVIRDVIVKLKNTKDSVAVFVHSPTLALQEVQLSWKIPAIKNAIVLGDAYGNELMAI